MDLKRGSDGEAEEALEPSQEAASKRSSESRSGRKRRAPKTFDNSTIPKRSTAGGSSRPAARRSSTSVAARRRGGGAAARAAAEPPAPEPAGGDDAAVAVRLLVKAAQENPPTKTVPYGPVTEADALAPERFIQPARVSVELLEDIEARLKTTVETYEAMESKRGDDGRRIASVLWLAVFCFEDITLEDRTLPKEQVNFATVEEVLGFARTLLEEQQAGGEPNELLLDFVLEVLHFAVADRSWEQEGGGVCFTCEQAADESAETMRATLLCSTGGKPGKAVLLRMFCDSNGVVAPASTPHANLTSAENSAAMEQHLVQEWIMELITSGFITGVLLAGNVESNGNVLALLESELPDLRPIRTPASTAEREHLQSVVRGNGQRSDASRLLFMMAPAVQTSLGVETVFVARRTHHACPGMTHVERALLAHGYPTLSQCAGAMGSAWFRADELEYFVPDSTMTASIPMPTVLRLGALERDGELASMLTAAGLTNHRLVSAACAMVRRLKRGLDADAQFSGMGLTTEALFNWVIGGEETQLDVPMVKKRISMYVERLDQGLIDAVGASENPDAEAEALDTLMQHVQQTLLVSMQNSGASAMVPKDARSENGKKGGFKTKKTGEQKECPPDLLAKPVDVPAVGEESEAWWYGEQRDAGVEAYGLGRAFLVFDRDAHRRIKEPRRQRLRGLARDAKGKGGWGWRNATPAMVKATAAEVARLSSAA